MRSTNDKINLASRLFPVIELSLGNNLDQPILLTGRRGPISVTGGGIDLNEALDSLLKYGVEYLSDELDARMQTDDI